MTVAYPVLYHGRKLRLILYSLRIPWDLTHFDIGGEFKHDAHFRLDFSEPQA